MKKILSGVFLLLVLLLIVASLFDLQIAKLVFVKDNLFSYIFEHLAPAVFGTILMMGASFIFIPSILIQRTNILIKLVAGLVYVLFNFFGIFMCFHYLGVPGLLVGLVLLFMIGFFVKKLPQSLWKSYRFVGIAILLTALCSMLTVESLKPIFGRIRFRSMQENFELFSNWYKVNGSNYLSSVPLKEEIKSFPSDHSQWAGTTLTLSLIPLVALKWRSKESLVFSLTLLYTFIVMLSRMMQGAHFLSDVTVGFSISFISFLIFRKFLVIDHVKISDK